MNIQELTETQYKELKLILTNRYKHTKKRIKQRFGLCLKESQYYKLINSVISGDSVILFKNNYVEFHCVLYKNTNIIVVYEPKTLSIRTALGLEQFR